MYLDLFLVMWSIKINNAKLEIFVILIIFIKISKRIFEDYKYFNRVLSKTTLFIKLK